MLKKHFVFMVVLACLLLGWLHTPAVEAYDLQMYTVTNATATRAKTQVSITDVIVPGKDWIIGYELAPYGASCVDPFVELHDVATTGAQDATTGGTMFSVNELDTSPLTADVRIFPSPKKISLGLSINLGGYTSVVIYYETRLRH